MERSQDNAAAELTTARAEKPAAMSRRSFLATAAASAAVAATAGSAFAGTDQFGRDRDWTGNETITYP